MDMYFHQYPAIQMILRIVCRCSSVKQSLPCFFATDSIDFPVAWNITSLKNPSTFWHDMHLLLPRKLEFDQYLRVIHSSAPSIVVLEPVEERIYFIYTHWLYHVHKILVAAFVIRAIINVNHLNFQIFFVFPWRSLLKWMMPFIDSNFGLTTIRSISTSFSWQVMQTRWSVSVLRLLYGTMITLSSISRRNNK